MFYQGLHRYSQIESSTIDGNSDYLYTLSTAVFWRHKCQLSFCVGQNNQ